MAFFKFIVYTILVFTPPFGWVLLYLTMKQERDQKEFKKILYEEAMRNNPSANYDELFKNKN